MCKWPSPSKPFVQEQVSTLAMLWWCALAACVIWVSVVSATPRGMLLYPLSGSAVISTMVHAGESRAGMLHMLSVQRSFMLVENILLLGIVSVGLFLFVNLDVTCCNQVILYASS